MLLLLQGVVVLNDLGQRLFIVLNAHMFRIKRGSWQSKQLVSSPQWVQYLLRVSVSKIEDRRLDALCPHDGTYRNRIWKGGDANVFKRPVASAGFNFHFKKS